MTITSQAISETQLGLELFELSELNATRRQIGRYYPDEVDIISLLTERINSPGGFETPIVLDIDSDEGVLAVTALYKCVFHEPETLGEYVEQAQAAAILGIELNIDGALAMQWAIAAANFANHQKGMVSIVTPNTEMQTHEYDWVIDLDGTAQAA